MPQMKFLDGTNIKTSCAAEIAQVITNLAYPHSSQVIVTDTKGNYIERIRLFEETLSDGSKARKIEIQFEDEK
jgi:hypothetical protein